MLVSATKALFAQDHCITPWDTYVKFDGTWQNGITYPTYWSNGQVGLAAFNGKLILTWGDEDDGTFNSMTSQDGIHWTNHREWPGFPPVKDSFPDVEYSLSYAPPYASGGVEMTVSPSSVCPPGYVYAAYADEDGTRIYGARSSDGVNWEGNHLIWTIPLVDATNLIPRYYPFPPYNPYLPPPSDYFSTAAPALYGDDPAGDSAHPIGFAFPDYYGREWQPAYKGSGGYTYTYKIRMGVFGCNFEDPQLLPPSWNFYWNQIYEDNLLQSRLFDGGFEGFSNPSAGSYRSDHYVPSGPWSPLWTGANGIEFRAVGLGAPVGNANPPIWYSKNYEPPSCLGPATCGHLFLNGDWSNNGLGGGVNPADGSLWLVWGCRMYNSDTCDSRDGFGYFNLFRESATGDKDKCVISPPNGGSQFPYSRSMAAMTFFDGKLWLAWRHHYGNGHGVIGVASIDPADIGWNGPPPCTPNGGACGDPSECCSGACSGGECTDCLPIGAPCEDDGECCSGHCYWTCAP